MSANLLRRSFAGGEITPELYGRLDLTKFQTGAALIQNAIVLPHGPVRRRAGFRFAVEAKDSTRRVRTIPFAFNDDQTFALEFGHLYIRFITNGELLLEANQAVASVAGGTITTSAAHGWSTGNDVFVGGRFWRVAATPDADEAALEDRWGAPATFSAAPTTAARVYTLVSPYAEGNLFGLTYSQDNDVLTLAHPQLLTRELRRLAPASWSLTTLSFATTLLPPGSLAVTPTVAVSTNLTAVRYVVTSVGTDNITESAATSPVSGTNNLTLAGNFNVLTWVAAAEASRYNIYKERGGTFGFIGQTAGLTINDDNILPDTTRTPPEALIVLNNTAGNYPAAVAQHEQRRWFGGTISAPQTVYATRSATQSNLTSSVPTQDDDALEFRLASQKQNTIRHLFPLIDLIALTAGGEFRIFSDNAPAITASALSIKPQGYTGASQVQPALTGGAALYVQASGSHLREMAYNWQTSTFASIDLSLMAPHLVDGFEIADLAHALGRAGAVLWCVRSDGALLGMTYVPEHQVYAWHQHHTDGIFESVCAVRENNLDALYVVVRRVIDGRTVRYIERLCNTCMQGGIASAFFVDSGATYSGAETSTVSGLHHLEGRTVAVLADGGTHPERTVVGGSIEIETPAAVVHVGLPFATRLQTLPAAFEAAPAGGQSVMKNVNGVAVRVSRTNLVKAGPNFDSLTEFMDRDTEDLFGAPPALRNEEMRFEITPDWNSDGSVCIEQDKPLPLTVLSIALDVATGS